MQTLDALTATLGEPVDIWRDGGGRRANAAIARWQHTGRRIDFGPGDAIHVVFNVSGGHNVELRFPDGPSTVLAMSAGSVGLNSPGWPSGVTVDAPADTLQIVLSLDSIRAIAGNAADHASTVSSVSRRALQGIAVQALVAFRCTSECEHQLVTIARRAVRLFATPQTIVERRTAALVPAKRERVDALISTRLRADPCTPPSLREMADVAALSVHHFIKAFQGSEGLTPHAYVNARRLDEALTLILSDDGRVSGIADGLGFSSPAHFVNVFRKQFGVTPGALRAAIS